MNLGSTLFLASAVSLLVALQTYSAVEIESFIAANLERIGMALLALALVSIWQAKPVQRIAFYIAVIGVAYLLLQHGDDIVAIVGGVHVY